MDCVGCGSAAVTERPDPTAQGYRRFRCRDCGKQFDERSDGVLNRASLPSDIIAFVVFCRLRYRLTLRDLSEIMLLRGFTVSHECIRRWEAKLLPVNVNGATVVDAAPAKAGIPTKPTSRSKVGGATCIARSIATGTSSTRC
jgi:transposase-like protein